MNSSENTKFSQPAGIDSGLTVIGLDIEDSPLYVVRTLVRGHEPTLLEAPVLSTLHDLEGYVAGLSSGARAGVCFATARGPDPMGVLDWLSDRDYEVECFPFGRDIDHVPSLTAVELPPTHHVAWSVSVLAAFRRHPREAAQEILAELQYLRHGIENVGELARLLLATFLETDPSDEHELRRGLSPFYPF